MEQRIEIAGGRRIAVLRSDEVLISDTQSALDLIATLRYTDDADAIALNKSAIAEDFFRLGSGIAGDVLQKFAQYRMRLAIYGDFSVYTSKPLHDFIYESNNGREIGFLETESAAIAWLAR